MNPDLAGLTVTVKRTLKKFDGEFEEGKEPVEVTTSEDTVPFTSLPQFIQDDLVRRGQVPGVPPSEE